MKHIAIFLPALSGGGAERIALVLAEEFIQMGIRVDIVLAHFQGEYLNQIPDGVQIIDLKASRMIFAAPKLAHYLKTHKPDGLLSTIELANIITLLAKLLSGSKVPWVIRQADYPDELKRNRSVKNKFLFYLLIRAFRSSDHIIAISKGVGEKVVVLSNVPKQKITAIFNPAFYRDLEQKSIQPIDEDWKKSSKQVIISVGRLSPVKNFSLLINAFNLVHQSNPRANLLILGEGSEREKLEKLVHELQLENFVSMPGFKENPMAYISRANVFALSSISEGFGNVLVEALACGCPVVSTDCPSGPREILNDGEFGYLVPVGDSEAMADAILEVLNGKAKPISQGWLDQFKPQPIAQQYMKVFENLMKQRSHI